VQPWELLDTTPVPGTDTQMSLHRRGDVFSIRVGGVELMNNWIYGIDCGLADHGCAALADPSHARVLIGGLGMGFTLARTLSLLGPESEVFVAELVPGVVRWNETLLGDLAEHPLRDERVTVVEDDVGRLLRAERGAWDAILLDVDNGPEGLSRKSNDGLYDGKGLAAARAALRPGGVLAIWSLSGDRIFSERMTSAGFAVEEHQVKKRGGRARQTIFVGRPRDGAATKARSGTATKGPSGAPKARAPQAGARGRERRRRR
jgi:spermidine synthase